MSRISTRALVATCVLAGLLAGVAVTTAIAVGTSEPSLRIAFVSRSDNPADALAAGPVAAQLGAVLFTTPATSLAPAASEGLTAYAPDLVIITGGDSAIAPAVEVAIEAATGLDADKVVRVLGDDRHETAVAIAGLLDVLPRAYQPAATGPVAVAAAFVRPVAGGDPALTRDHGFTAIRAPELGTYCLALDPTLGLAPDDVVVTTTPETSLSGGSGLEARWDAASCQDGEVGVKTTQADDDTGFDLPHDGVAFAVVVHQVP